MKLDNPYPFDRSSQGNSKNWGRRRVAAKYSGDMTFEIFFKAGPIDLVGTVAMEFLFGLKLGHIYYHEVGVRGNGRWDRTKYNGQGVAIRVYSTIISFMNFISEKEEVDAFHFTGRDVAQQNILDNIVAETEVHWPGFVFVDSLIISNGDKVYLMCKESIMKNQQSNLLEYVENM